MDRPNWKDREQWAHWLRQLTFKVRRTSRTTRNWLKIRVERLAIGARRAWPPTRDWVQHSFHRWRALPPKGKGTAIGIGCGVLLLLSVTISFRESNVKIDGDRIDVRYTSGDGVPDSYWARREGLEIAKLVWHLSKKYPKQTGYITVRVIYGGRGKIWSDHGKTVNPGEEFRQVVDDLLEVHQYRNEYEFLYNKRDEYAAKLISYRRTLGGPWERIYWRGEFQTMYEVDPRTGKRAGNWKGDD